MYANDSLRLEHQTHHNRHRVPLQHTHCHIFVFIEQSRFLISCSLWNVYLLIQRFHLWKEEVEQDIKYADGLNVRDVHKSLWTQVNVHTTIPLLTSLHKSSHYKAIWYRLVLLSFLDNLLYCSVHILVFILFLFLHCLNCKNLVFVTNISLQFFTVMYLCSTGFF